MNPTSRRLVAKFIARQLANGESPARVAKVLAAYLVSNRQTRQCELIIRDIETELLDKYGHLSARVSSARKLDDAARKKMIAVLKTYTGAQTVELDETVDQNLLGGVIVSTPEAEMDASLRKKITRLKAI